MFKHIKTEKRLCLNPLKRVNSILTPGTGKTLSAEIMFGLNPLKRVNSILTLLKLFHSFLQILVSIPSNGSIQFLQYFIIIGIVQIISLNPLKRVNSILTVFSRFFRHTQFSLNPLKRVNSILTYAAGILVILPLLWVSIPSNGSIQFLRINPLPALRKRFNVSIPSNGSIQFLLGIPERTLLSFIKSVSIPSNGSIQFLPHWDRKDSFHYTVSIPSNGSIQFLQREY